MSLPWTADEWREVDRLYAQIPEPEVHRLFVKCSECGDRFWNQPLIGYQTHYLAHLVNGTHAEAGGASRGGSA